MYAIALQLWCKVTEQNITLSSEEEHNPSEYAWAGHRRFSEVNQRMSGYLIGTNFFQVAKSLETNCNDYFSMSFFFFNVLAGLLVIHVRVASWPQKFQFFLQGGETRVLHKDFLKYQRSWQCLLLAGRLHFQHSGPRSNMIHLASNK